MTTTVCETVTVREAAERIGISYRVCLDLIKTKKLHAKWLGNKFLVPVASITAFLNAEDAA